MVKLTTRPAIVGLLGAVVMLGGGLPLGLRKRSPKPPTNDARALTRAEEKRARRAAKRKATS